MTQALSFGNNLIKFNNYVLDASSVPDPPTPSGISLLPMSAWTIAPKSASTVSVTNDNTLSCTGISGCNELIYTRFQPEESGTYTFNLSWNAPNGVDFGSTETSTRYRQLGVWFDTTLNINNTNTYEGARSQGILMIDEDATSAVSFDQTGTLTLYSSVNYYVWISLGVLQDFVTQVFNFTDIRLNKV